MKSFFAEEFEMSDKSAREVPVEMLVAIDEGIRAADHGEFASATEVRDMFAEWGMTVDECVASAIQSSSAIAAAPSSPVFG